MPSPPAAEARRADAIHRLVVTNPLAALRASIGGVAIENAEEEKPEAQRPAALLSGTAQHEE